MEPRCETCAHFVRHYAKLKETYIKTSGGHCRYPRIKLRFDYTPACGHYKTRAES